MRNDHLPSHKHEVVYAHSCPVPPAAPPFAPANAQLGANFAAAIEKKPHIVPLFHFAGAAWGAGAIVKNKGDKDLARFDGVLHQQEFLAQLFSRLGFAQQGGFRHCFRHDIEVRIRTESFSGGAITGLRGWG